ncbi:hypothetical protein KKH18_14460 [bacterium]|nr:hypothetical protein [bacterium]
MKRSYMAMIMVAVISLLILGCSSPAEQAQQMFQAGQYQQLIDKFGNDPAMSEIVTKAKEMLAEALLKEGKYEELLEMYPDSKVSGEAKSKLAEMLVAEGKYEEAMEKYPETTAAIKAKLMLEQQRGDSLAAVAGEQGEQIQKQGAKIEAQKETIEVAAKRELDRIMKIKNPRLRETAMKEFVDNPKFKGTQAVKDAADQLKK